MTIPWFLLSCLLILLLLVEQTLSKGPLLNVEDAYLNAEGLLPQSGSSDDNNSSAYEELIPVLPNPLRRLQANYETSKVEPGVMVIDECCAGCCTLTPTTVYTTLKMTSTNVCFFTTLFTTTTDTTIFTTLTTTAITTKTSNLKILETTTTFTTLTFFSRSYTTLTITTTVFRDVTSISLATAGTLVLDAQTSVIEGTVTRQIPYFVPYTIFASTTSTLITVSAATFAIVSLTSTIFIYGGGTTFVTTKTTLTETSLILASARDTLTSFDGSTSVTGIRVSRIGTTYTVDEGIFTTTFSSTYATISSTNTVNIGASATIVLNPGAPVVTFPTTLSLTYSRIN